ncbi:hypothetical protein KCU83_g438, partial [Aureobasidium melanogenum]
MTRHCFLQNSTLLLTQCHESQMLCVECTPKRRCSGEFSGSCPTRTIPGQLRARSIQQLIHRSLAHVEGDILVSRPDVGPQRYPTTTLSLEVTAIEKAAAYHEERVYPRGVDLRLRLHCAIACSRRSCTEQQISWEDDLRGQGRKSGDKSDCTSCAVLIDQKLGSS